MPTGQGPWCQLLTALSTTELHKFQDKDKQGLILILVDDDPMHKTIKLMQETLANNKDRTH